MTSVTDENVFNLAVEGTFDDCQVRSSFAMVFHVQIAYRLGISYLFRTLSRHSSLIPSSMIDTISELSIRSIGLESSHKLSTTSHPTSSSVHNSPLN